MSRVLLQLLCLSLGVQALVGRCAHAEKQPREVPSRKLSRVHSPSHMSAYVRGNDWEPIRISVYFGPLNITEPLKRRLEDSIHGAKNWFRNTLRVRRVWKPWQLMYWSCLDTDFTGPIVTDEFEADFVLYVIADMEPNGMAGYSVYCQVDFDTDQPVVGLYYFNGRAHENSPDEEILSTTIHELTHMLAFSNSLYPYFRKPDGRRYMHHELFLEETVRGYSVLKLALPTVTQKARQAFNCSELNGLELEAEGGPGSAGVHWEKRLMYNDFMVADSDIHDIVYSDITLALFADSSWYQVNYKYSSPIQWGRNRGCTFLSEKCVSNAQPLTPDFCTEQSEGCDFMGLRKGKCNLKELSDWLPSQYRYFSQPDLGGSDWYLDSCPVVKPFINGNCRDPDSVMLRPNYEETAGLSSRCLQWNGRRMNNSLSTRVGCYHVDCSDELAVVTIGGKKEFCPESGGEIYVIGHDGVLLCPARAQLCAPKPCVNNCYGLGYCKNSTCVCDDGSDTCNYQYSAALLHICTFIVLTSFVSI